MFGQGYGRRGTMAQNKFLKLIYYMIGQDLYSLQVLMLVNLKYTKIYTSLQQLRILKNQEEYV